MGLRNYSNLASNTTNTGTIASSTPGLSTVIAVADQTGWPAAPFTAAIDRGTAAEEIVLVTSVSGLNLTCQRGYDGTGAVTHAPGRPFEHVTAKADYSEANAHVNATADAHADGSGNTTISRIRQPSGNDVTLASTDHPFQIGASTDQNVRMDQFGTIQADWNGSENSLFLNPFGGGVWVDSMDPQDQLKGAFHERMLWRSEQWAEFAGTITLTTAYILGWTNRIIIMGEGGGNGDWISTAGYINLTQPAATFTISMWNDNGTIGNQVATAAGIPIPNWCALYYEIEPGTDGTVSHDTNWNLVSYLGTGFQVPDNWIRVAQRNTDNGMVRLAGGLRIGAGCTYLGSNVNEDYIAPTLAQSWINYGSGYNPAGYAIDANGYVHLRGLIKNGTFSGTLPVFTLPTGYHPPTRCLFASYSNGTLGRVDVLANGQVVITSGDNGFLSLENVIFKATA